MNTLVLDCFIEENNCQVSSDLKNWQISDLVNQELTLQINNHADQDCQVALFFKSSEELNTISKVKLLINDEQQIYFHDDLSVLLNSPLALGTISHQSTNRYMITLDFAALLLDIKSLSWHFDMVLDFACESPSTNADTVMVIKEGSGSSSQASVLASTVGPVSVEQRPFFHSVIFYLILSSLFVAIFFVIISFVHGKKKNQNKKQSKKKDLLV